LGHLRHGSFRPRDKSGKCILRCPLIFGDSLCVEFQSDTRSSVAHQFLCRLDA